MGQYTNTGAAGPTSVAQLFNGGANPLMQMLQGILASSNQQLGMGMGGAMPTAPQQPLQDGRTAGAYADRFSPYGNIDVPQGVNTMAFNGLNGQLMGMATSPQAMPSVADLWNNYIAGAPVQTYSAPMLPPGGGYPVQPPNIVGPTMPPGPGSRIRPPWMLGQTLPTNPGTIMRPPWIINQQGPPAGVPQPNNAGPAASTFVGQPNPFQKTINAMNNGNPMKPPKPGIL